MGSVTGKGGDWNRAVPHSLQDFVPTVLIVAVSSYVKTLHARFHGISPMVGSWIRRTIVLRRGEESVKMNCRKIN